MNFNSIEFIIFLVTVLILYWVLPHKVRWIMLLAASYYFYMSWNARLIFLIVGVTLLSYVSAILISRADQQKVKRFWLALTLVVCIGLLIFFKYFNFLMQSAIDFLNLFSMNLDDFSLDIILPVGISFYTFQTLSYVIDVYRGTVKPEYHLGYYALFVCYFPQLVAGPIERPGDLIPQLKTEQKMRFENMSSGFRIMLTGFFRKCVIADFCGIFVNNLYSDIGNATSLAVFVAGLLFIMQIYNDFAGYSEIATGAALMMGVKLTRNFNRPFTSLSLTEFFRRWHITLNRWFIDYVYIPLGGSRKGTARTVFNTLVVFSLSGLWHGANWTYVLWGLISGIVVVAETLCKKYFQKRKRTVFSDYLKRVGLMCFFALTAILFRADSITQYGELLQRFFTGFTSDFFAATFNSLGMTTLSFFQLILVFVCMNFICSFGDFSEDKKQTVSVSARNLTAEHSLYAQRASVYIYAILAIAISWIAILSMGDASAFLYFQF